MTVNIHTARAAMRAMWDAAGEQATEPSTHHFTDAEERAIDRHLDQCDGCRRCRRKP